jgi:putative membrane protein
MKVSRDLRQVFTGAVVGLLLAAPVCAQVSKDPPVPPVQRDDPKPLEADAKAPLSAPDRQLMETMARAGVAEVEVGRIAESSAANPDVKKFARQMVEDHGKSNRELQELAARKGVTLPNEPDPAQKDRIADMKKKNGAAFDQAYVDQSAIPDHVAAKELFEKVAKSAEDPDLRAFAQKNLPVIDHHLEMAKQIGGTLAQGAAASAPAS